MKKYLLVILLLLGSSNVSGADPPDTIDGFTWQEREAAYLVLHGIDWLQTLYLVDKMNDMCTRAKWIVVGRGPDMVHRAKRTVRTRCHPDMYEKNPVLGKHPTAGEVNRYFALTAVGHIAVSWALPRDWKPIWQYGTSMMEAYVIMENDEVGLGIKIGF